MEAAKRVITFRSPHTACTDSTKHRAAIFLWSAATVLTFVTKAVVAVVNDNCQYFDAPPKTNPWYFTGGRWENGARVSDLVLFLYVAGNPVGAKFAMILVA